MSALSFLVGLPTSDPVYMSEGTEDIAYAYDWVPLGWLALFETGDVRMVSGAAPEDQTPCPTLLTQKDLALSSFQRRLALYSDAISTDLLDAFRALESIIVNSCSKYLQAILTDMDIFLSEPQEMTKELRNWIGAMDTTLPNRWSAPLSFVQATVGKNLREIHFSCPDLVRAAIYGYVSRSRRRG
jgi:hypothetical protein